MRNVEIKARISSIGEIQGKLAGMGVADPTSRLAQVDTYFDVPDGRMKLREFVDDQHAASELIFYKRANDSGAKLSEYEIVEVQDPDATKQLLSAALGVKAIVEKQRHLYMLGRTRVHLDEVKDLGSFLEIEVVLAEGEPLTDGEAEARSIMKDLDINAGDLVSDSYSDLMIDQAASEIRKGVECGLADTIAGRVYTVEELLEEEEKGRRA